MGIIVRNMNMNNFSNVRLGIGSTKIKMPTYGTGLFAGKEYNYLIPLQGNTNSINMDGVDSSYSSRWSGYYSIGKLFNRTHVSVVDGFLSGSTTGEYVQLEFNFNFYMDAFYIKGLRSDQWGPGNSAIQIKFTGDSVWTTITTYSGISTGDRLFELDSNHKNRAIDSIRIISLSGWVSYSRFDLLQEV